jgi:hypothetical protein
MPRTLLLVSLLLAPSLFAQSADLEITQFRVDRELTHTGERFTFVMGWRNNGPDAARNVRVELTGLPVPFFILNVATSGWPCYPTPDGSIFLCQNASLASGAAAEMVVQMLTPPTPGSFTLTGSISSALVDSNSANNRAQTTAQLEAAPSVDLSMTPASQLFVANANEQVSMELDVANGGDRTVDNPIAYIAVPVTDDQPSFNVSGSGWSCERLAFGPQAVVCTRRRLEAGVHAPLTVTTTAPASEGSFTIYARVRGEGHSDPFTLNDSATLTVRVGEEEVPPPPPAAWNMRLLPVIGEDIPGSGGTLWRTEVTALINGDTGLVAQPTECTFANGPCGSPQFPTRQPFNAYEYRFAGFLQGAVGQFVYVHENADPNVHFNIRVYDVSRQEETAGAEVPIPRQDDFTSAPVSIVGIPVAPQYRHTLRIYDRDARNGGQVQIRLYANQETTPRVTLVRPLAVPPGARTTTPYNLPTHPGVIQLELGQHMNLAGLESVRVDIEPIDAGLRLWSFVSVTNNDTHHVTTFSQH